MTRVLLVGSGAREHAIAAALAKSPNADLYAAMSTSNPGITKLARDATILQINDAQAVSDYAKGVHIELAVIGPEAPLVNGVVDSLTEEGIACVGPTQRLALLEGDKSFCRNLLSKYGIAGNPLFRSLHGTRFRRSISEDRGARRDKACWVDRWEGSQSYRGRSSK